MNKKIKALPEEYNYYHEIKNKSDRLAIKLFKEKNNDILSIQLYNLIINICNQVVYDYTYTFNKNDLYFIVEHNINIDNLIDMFKNDIIKMKMAQ